MEMNRKPRPTEPRQESPSSERPADPTSLPTCGGLKLRHARPEDAPLAAQLLYATLGPMADYLLGNDSATEAQDILGRLFAQDANRFSYQFASVAEGTTDVCGLLIAYPYTTMQQIRLTTARHILRVCGVWGLTRFIWRSIPLIGIKEAEPGQYFIDAVAVLATMRGRGIGTRLLRHAEAQAIALGRRACSLTVEINNERASRLYMRLGYRVVEAIHIPTLARRLGYSGLYRMVKPLNVA